jgi:hypothetical protein
MTELQFCHPPIAAGKDRADDRHDDIGYKRRHDFSGRGAHDETDGQRQNRILEQKLFKTFDHVMRLPLRKAHVTTKEGGLWIASRAQGRFGDLGLAGIEVPIQLQCPLEVLGCLIFLA